MDSGLAIALVRAHLINEPQYQSRVPGYVKVRAVGNSLVAEHIGEHMRRKPMCKRAIDALACVCSQPVLANPRVGEPPVGNKRNR
ncbi:MAG: hypothetical protein CMJ58_06390 [Planctomycetaceae bacterium]|jgi:hypothetical protein|nr:hypothetical protein [Planctomycetaceae bacterium]